MYLFLLSTPELLLNLERLYDFVNLWQANVLNYWANLDYKYRLDYNYIRTVWHIDTAWDYGSVSQMSHGIWVWRNIKQLYFLKYGCEMGRKGHLLQIQSSVLKLLINAELTIEWRKWARVSTRGEGWPGLHWTVAYKGLVLWSHSWLVVPSTCPPSPHTAGVGAGWATSNHGVQLQPRRYL